jgi:periplasmic protein TonB
MRQPESSPFVAALVFSIVLHAMVLAIRFNLPQKIAKVFPQAPLEVILVNAKSNKFDQHAKSLAQVNLDGGGESSSGRAASPLISSEINQIGDALDTSNPSQIKSMQQEQSVLMSAVYRQIAAIPLPNPQRNETAQEYVQHEKKRQALLKLLAEIEANVHLENIRPKKRFISPSTKEVAYAAYYDAMRRSIEKQGTIHFPEQNGKKLYGNLTMTITISSNGQLLNTEIIRSSGDPLLDKYAALIVWSTTPFGQFSQSMRAQADQIVVVTHFKFGRDNTVETRAVSG